MRRRDPDRFDHRLHSCGCETYWSLSKDKSIAVVRCGEHAPHDPNHLDKEPTR